MTTMEDAFARVGIAPATKRAAKLIRRCVVEAGGDFEQAWRRLAREGEHDPGLMNAIIGDAAWQGHCKARVREMAEELRRSGLSLPAGNHGLVDRAAPPAGRAGLWDVTREGRQLDARSPLPHPAASGAAQRTLAEAWQRDLDALLRRNSITDEMTAEDALRWCDAKGHDVVLLRALARRCDLRLPLRAQVTQETYREAEKEAADANAI